MTDIKPTMREMEVLILMASGLNDSAIGKAMSISMFTAQDHAKSLLRKLGTRNRVSAVVRALKLGWLQLEHISVAT